ncbi:PAAR domain-containing protein [Burkholderia guangdongensis]|uniref:PAAR domain-containing protein n=1 Tax=Burkholderia guangdongensis TaxID=1792500 RepID=UPI0015CCD062|nr:PAAR domain-containing protein [Burkholderia guangdongensis]
MSFAFIREGDSTSHGGKILTCSPLNKSDDKAIALLGDMVSCPRCGGVFPIVTVKPLGVSFDGRPVASHGDVTACGATLIASQNTTTASPTSGPGGAIGGGKSVLPETNPQTPHRGRFQVLDDTTRQPVAGHSYTVRSADGRVVQGKTDTKGFTDWLDGHDALSLTFNQPGSEGVA